MREQPDDRPDLFEILLFFAWSVAEGLTLAVEDITCFFDSHPALQWSLTVARWVSLVLAGCLAITTATFLYRGEFMLATMAFFGSGALGAAGLFANAIVKALND